MKSILQTQVNYLTLTNNLQPTSIYMDFMQMNSALIEYTERGMDQYVCSTVIVNQTRVLLSIYV